MKFCINNLFTKCDQIRKNLQIWSYLLKKYFNGKLPFLCGNIHDFRPITFRLFDFKKLQFNDNNTSVFNK